MANLKKYVTQKFCTIKTPHDVYQECFTSDWSFSDMRSWMIDTYCIDESSIVEIQHSSITYYKRPKS